MGCQTRGVSRPERKKRQTRGKADGIRFEWDEHGLASYDVPVQDRTHEDSGDLIAAKIHKDWDEEEEQADQDPPA